MAEHDNRIGWECWYKPDTHWARGWLRAWSTSYDEFEAGPAMFPVAVVEDRLGRMHVVNAEFVTFAGMPPGTICDRDYQEPG